MEDRTLDFTEFLNSLARATSPDEAAKTLLRAAIGLVPGDRGRLYLLDLATAEYSSYVQSGRKAKGNRIAVPRDGADPAILPPIERAAVTKHAVLLAGPSTSDQSPSYTGSYGSRVIIPIIRGTSTCIGILDVDSDTPWAFRGRLESITSRLHPILGMANLLYDWRSRRKLLAEAQQPVHYDQSEGEFFEELMSVTALASQMEFIALRELADDGALDTIASYGFEQPRDELDLLHPGDIPSFHSVLDTRKPYDASSMDSELHVSLRSMPALEGVRSFVACPVLVGTDIFGVLSFASSLEYEYTTDEILGLNNLANRAGIAILNYRHFHSTMLNVAHYNDIGTAITAVQVAQAARHEGLGLIDDAFTSVLIAQQNTQSRPPKLSVVLESLDDLDLTLQGLSNVFDKIKSASKTPAQDRELIAISMLWEQAKGQVLGKLSSARIVSAPFEGSLRTTVSVAPDWFRQVFINLLLNSAEAFAASNAQRRNRYVRLIIDRVLEKDKLITMTYIDNAGGINFQALRSVDGKPMTDPPEQAVFAANVSSRADGSGWGLAIVRRILKDHGGSIDLGDQRGGASFRLTLPRPDLEGKNK